MLDREHLDDDELDSLIESSKPPERFQYTPPEGKPNLLFGYMMYILTLVGLFISFNVIRLLFK
jgi:hypothetical protein